MTGRLDLLLSSRRGEVVETPRDPTMTATPNSKALGEIQDLFEELTTLLKNPDVGAELAAKGVNISLAMVAADGLRAYLEGDKARAAEDLGTAAEEIATRLSSGERGSAS
jgi:hypothetical protein